MWLGGLYTDDTNADTNTDNDGQSMIGSLVDKPNEPKSQFTSGIKY